MLGRVFKTSFYLSRATFCGKTFFDNFLKLLSFLANYFPTLSKIFSDWFSKLHFTFPLTTTKNK